MDGSISRHLVGFSDSRAYAYKKNWLKFVKTTAFKRGIPFDGVRILEIGAGVHNPLGSAILSLADGATFALAIEPGGFLEEHLEEAALLTLIARHNSIFENHRLTRVFDQLANWLTAPPISTNLKLEGV